jgi:peptidoglycan DL-endopeptidase RipA
MADFLRTTVGSGSVTRSRPTTSRSRHPIAHRCWPRREDPLPASIAPAEGGGPPPAGVPGLEVSLRDLLERGLLQLGVREQPVERGVLALKIFEPRGVIGLQAAELVAPAVVGRLRNPSSRHNAATSLPSLSSRSAVISLRTTCSGLCRFLVAMTCRAFLPTRWAARLSYAGVGAVLPHYSGSQYAMGRQIPSAEMRRGDVIFYGPEGSQHVTLYLCDGQCLKRPIPAR